MIVADTDVLIDFLNDKEPAASRIAFELERATLWTTVISRFELLAGARTNRQKDAVQDLLAAVPPLSLDAAASDHAARVRRELERQGQGIGMADSLIAGIVLHHSGAILTRNHRHFQRVHSLQVLQP